MQIQDSSRYAETEFPGQGDPHPLEASALTDIASPPRESIGNSATLKLRLSLLITAILAMATLAGGVYIVQKARDDTREEALSTVTLTTHLLDAQLEMLTDQWSIRGYTTPQFRLRQLSGIRHLNVRFYDTRGRLLDSNEDAEEGKSTAPRWFASMIRLTSPPLLSVSRPVYFNTRIVGRLAIEPDPSYETNEMWATCRALLGLLLGFFVLVNAVVWWAASRALRPVGRIIQALEALRHGNLSTRLPGLGLPELSRISVGFNHMAETLEHSVAENQRLTRQLLKTQEMERVNLARDLHDEIGQCVSAIHADAAAIRNRGSGSVRESAEAIVEVTEHIKQIVRGMLQRLRPPILEGLGLTPALRELVAAFQQRNPRVGCTLRSDGEFMDLDPEAAVAIYRIVQECLTNIGVHANARHAVVEVARDGAAGPSTPSSAAYPGHVRVTVTDDGVGFFLMSVNRGFGLTGIRERIKLLGGTCEIDTRPGRGTRIAIDIPLPPKTDGDV